MNMNNLRTLSRLTLAALCLFPAALLAQDATVPTVPIDPGFVEKLAAQYPVIVTMLLVVGVLRLLLKPVIAALHWYAEQTATTKDDEWVQRVESSKITTSALFALDWLASIKIPKTSAPETPAPKP